jgi:hypothetical protein
MKKLLTLTVAGCILGLTTPSAFAAKAEGPKAKLFAKYDKNTNGSIDGEEKDALRKDFDANKEGDLKRLDKNKDGKLDDEEIAAIKPPEGKKKTEPKAKKEKSESGEKSGEKTEKKAEKQP